MSTAGRVAVRDPDLEAAVCAASRPSCAFDIFRQWCTEHEHLIQTAGAAVGLAKDSFSRVVAGGNGAQARAVGADAETAIPGRPILQREREDDRTHSP